MRRAPMNRGGKGRRMIIGRRSECYAAALSSAGGKLAIEGRMSSNHLLDREFVEHPLAAGLAYSLPQRFVVQQPVRAARELKTIAKRNEISGDAIHDKIAVAWNIGGDHRHAG